MEFTVKYTFWDNGYPISGKIVVTADTEDVAIELAQEQVEEPYLEVTPLAHIEDGIYTIVD